MSKDKNNFAREEKLPVFKEWNNWYMILIYVRLIQIILYYWLTQSFE